MVFFLYIINYYINYMLKLNYFNNVLRRMKIIIVFNNYY